MKKLNFVKVLCVLSLVLPLFFSPAFASDLTSSNATGGVVNLHRDDTDVVVDDLIGTIKFTHGDTQLLQDGVSAEIRAVAYTGDGRPRIQFLMARPTEMLEVMTIKDRAIGINNPYPSYFLEIGDFTTSALDYGSAFQNGGAMRTSCLPYSGHGDHNRFYNTNGLVGEIYTDGNSAYYASVSDYRLKENDRPIKDALSIVKKLRPIYHNFKTTPEKTEPGFFAHEVQAVIPSAVSGEKDAVDKEGEIIPQTLSNTTMVPIAFAALKDLLARVEILEKEIKKLDTKYSLRH